MFSSRGTKVAALSAYGSTAGVLKRAAAVWLVILVCETLQGTARRFVLEPIVGDLRARQLAVLSGSAIVMLAALVFVRWLKAVSNVQYWLCGALWVLATLAFEITAGRLTGATWQRIWSDFDVTSGGFLSVGMIVMLAAPYLSAKFHGIDQ